MEVDPSNVNVNDQSAASLFVVLSQSSSCDDAKYLLSQLNTSLGQIGEQIAPFKEDMISAIHAHVQEKTATINQQYVISYSNESTFEFNLLINSNLSQFKSSFRQFLQSEHKQKYFLNLTFDFNHNGDMNMSDSVVTCDDIQSHLSLYQPNGQNVHFIMNQKVLDSNKNWKLVEKQAGVTVKPIQSLLNQEAYNFDDFVNMVDRYMNKMPVDQLMDAPVCTGTLKIQRPSLYIFPASQGDSCYFAINGFTMLINGGYDRLKPCFWKFVNMLEQIDAVLVTHTDSDSLGGLTSLFQKKVSNADVKPRISVILGNLINSHNSHNLHSSPNKAATLIINELPNCTGNKSDSDLILEAIDRLQIKLQPLVIQRPLTEKIKLHYDHFRLYYKAYYGSLDLYLLTPNVQSSEFKDFCAQQQTMIAKMHKSNLAVQQVYRNLPSSHLASSVCLLVWQPSYKPDSANTALRLLFTGNCPQNVLFSALDKLKDFDLLTHPVYKIKSDLDQNQQYYNAIKKEVKVAKESATNKLNSSMSKSNGESKTAVSTTKAATRHLKPASAPAAPAKKTDTSISKPPMAEKKTAPTSSRQSMSGTTASKSSKPVEARPPASKPSTAKQPLKPAVPRSAPSKSEPVKKSTTAKPPVKKETKNSKTLSLSFEPVQSEQPTPEPVVESVVEQKEQVVIEQNFVNNVVVIESDNVEQIEQVEQVEVVEQVIEQQVVEHEQQVVENEPASNSQTGKNEHVEERCADVEMQEQQPETLASNQETIDKEINQPIGEGEEKGAPVSSEEPAIVEQPSSEPQAVEEQKEAQVISEQSQSAIVEQELQSNQPIGEGEEKGAPVSSEEPVIAEQSNNEPLVELEEQARSTVQGEEQQHQSEHVLAEAEKAYSNESPNLSPVKKDFCEQNALLEQHTNAPVSEDQLASDGGQNGNLDADEIVSGNIENREHGCKDDIMTRSFIEDTSDPSSNPFNPVKTLNESCDLNRTHELFQDEESSNTSRTEELVNGVEAVKIENCEPQPEINLLELPSPVNPENVGIASKRSGQPGSPSQNNDVKGLKSTSMGSGQKSARSAPIHPVYVELAYIPAHGNSSYVDADFFKRVRARHYVLSAVEFGEQILNALLDGKETWEDKNLQVSLVPTYESDVLRRWFENNQERLARLKVEITPAARHSIVTIDENPDLNCQAYKLEF